nr:type IV pilin [Halolamina sp. CBA1230]
MILASTVSVFVFGVADDVDEAAPTVAQSSGELVVQDGDDGGIVRLTHAAGDPLTVSNLEIAVDAQEACGKTGRLVNLPASGGDPNPTSEYVRGDDVFDNSYNSVGGPIGEAGGEWEVGETVTFRLAKSECPLESADTITVHVVHTPTDSIVIEKTLSAT